PIIRESIFLHDKALTIRAAPGRRPVLEFSAESEATHGDFVRLQTEAPLVLEGLEIRRVGTRDHSGDRAEWLVVCKNARFGVANCLFLIRPEPGITALWSNKSVLLEVRNCQFVLGPGCATVDWVCAAAGELLWDNNVVCGGAGPYCHYRHSVQDVSVQ